MNSTTVHRPLRVGIYWYSWLGIVALALVLRFTVFLGASSDQLFALASAYLLGTWLPIKGHQIKGSVPQNPQWQVHAFCLMGNHFHVLLETPFANLVDAMK